MKLKNIKIPQNPIFIVGFPRSGTTLLQSMFATQENIYSFQETHFFCTTMRYIQTDENGFIKHSCLNTVLKKIKENTDHEFSSDVTNEIRGFLKKHQLSTKMLFEFLVTDLLKGQVETDRLHGIQWIEKTPGHIFQLDIIHNFYPEAKYIEIIRNPFNAIYSAKTKFDDIDDITPSELAHRWKNGIDTFKRFKETHPVKAYSVKYEDLVNDPEGEFRNISKFLNITPDIEKLVDLQKTASHFVLKRETWKNNNVNSGISKSNADYKWTLNEKLKIGYLLRQELIEMSYSKSDSISQMVFNGWMAAISKLTNSKLFNPFKKPTKHLMRGVGLWPYQK